MLLFQNFQPCGPCQATDLADFWYLDDGDILCHPKLVLPCLQTFDIANAKIGAERHGQQTEVIYYGSDLENTPSDWKISEVRTPATVDTPAHGNIPLGVAVGPRRCIEDQLLANVDVIRAMHEQVQLCQDPQTEFVFLRESLGVISISHIIRVWSQVSH